MSNDTNPRPRAAAARVQEVLSQVETVMMITSPSGELLSSQTRPMAIARRDADGSLYFLSSEDFAKAAGLRRGDGGMCIGQTKTEHISLLGRFDVLHDLQLVKAIWNKSAEPAFPKGVEDPDIRVIVFHPASAEIWEKGTAANLTYLLDMAKNWMTAHVA
jgi:general stress protein 26